MTQPAGSGIEGRFAALEAAVRSLQAANWTDRASVVDASGNVVPLSSVAFGEAEQIWAGVGVVGMDGVSGASSSALTYPGVCSSTVVPANWFQPNPGLQLDVLVTGSQLRVDWASLLALGNTSGGGTAPAPYCCMSYSLDYLGDVHTHGSVPLSRTAAPDYYRSIQLRDNALVGATAQYGSWFRHTGLTPGWYRVQAAWFLGYGTSTGNGAPHMNADNPRIAARPY